MLKKFIYLILLAISFLVSCSDTTTGPSSPSPNDFHWTKSQSPLIIKNCFTVPKGETLVIDPGVEIRFQTSPNNNGFDYDSLQVGMLHIKGKLIAEGIETDSIIFTRNDDTEERNKWGIIFFDSSSVETNIIKHCIVEYGYRISNIKEFTIQSSGVVSFYKSNGIIENNRISHNFWNGISCENNSTISVIDNIISNNSSSGIISWEDCNPDISNNIIKDNFHYGIYLRDNSSPSITNNSIENNSKGIFCWEDSSPTITNNSFNNNVVGIVCWSKGNLNITDNIFVDNPYAGIECRSNATLTIINNSLINNIFHSNSSSISCWYSSNSIINNNTINYHLGYGIACKNNSNMIIVNNKIQESHHGIYTNDDLDLTIISNAIVNNIGTGIYCYKSNPKIANNTIANNDASGYMHTAYGIECNVNSNPIIINTIIWGNDYAFDISGNSSPTISYSLIQGDSLLSSIIDGGNNILNQDPLFLDEANENYQLQTGSPCINAGNNGIENLPETDILGNPRISGSSVDMGAYEYQE